MASGSPGLLDLVECVAASGLEHPKFTQIVAELTTAGSDKVARAAASLS